MSDPFDLTQPAEAPDPASLAGESATRQAGHQPALVEFRRQLAVKLALEGRSNADIAGLLDVSIDSVRRYLASAGDEIQSLADTHSDAFNRLAVKSALLALQTASRIMSDPDQPPAVRVAAAGRLMSVGSRVAARPAEWRYDPSQENLLRALSASLAPPPRDPGIDERFLL